MTVGIVLLLAITPVYGGVHELISAVNDLERSVEERNAALASLREMISGDMKLEETLESNFFLSRYYLETRGRSDNLTRQLLVSTTSLYPEDPRTPDLLLELATSELDRNDPFGAHNAFLRLMTQDYIDEHPVLAAQAAQNAARTGDMPTAFLWSQALDPTDLTEINRGDWLIASLQAGRAMGRHDVALTATEELLVTHAEQLRTQPEALFDAAMLLEEIGRDREAEDLYEWFVNLHTSSSLRPDAMLALARTYRRMGETEHARRTFKWLVESYQDAPQAQSARMALLALDERPIDLEQLPGYMAAARKARDSTGARYACNTIFDLYFGQGFPVEAIAALGYLARNDDGSLAFLAAQESLGRGIGAAIGLLDRRGDQTGIITVAAEATSAGVPIPLEHRDTVNAARNSMGLAPYPWTTLQHALQQAEGLAKAQQWDQVTATLEKELQYAQNPDPATQCRSAVLLVEGLWRAGRIEDALILIDAASTEAMAGGMSMDDPAMRPMLVLHADILFAAGDASGACPLYLKAGNTRSSAWVKRQLQRCEKGAAG